MMNHEITKVLARERQHQLTHSAVIARLARRARRNRRNVQADEVDTVAFVELPTSVTADAAHGHAVAA